MNYKLEKFWNSPKQTPSPNSSLWTINLKSFEINNTSIKFYLLLMNYKLEKFWNNIVFPFFSATAVMNYKLEKFWNVNKDTIFLYSFIDEL